MQRFRWHFGAMIGVCLAVWIVGCDRAAPQANSSPSTDHAPTSSAPAQPAPQPPTPTLFGGQQPGPSTAASDQPGNGPKITFESDKIDFGTISEVEQRHASFKFTNTGNQTLIIQQVKTTCGCTTAKLAKNQYQPGEGGQIDVTLDHSAPGISPKLVNVISNAVPDPLTRLTIFVYVLPFIDIQPPILNTGVLAYKQEHHFTVTISCPHDPNYVVESITMSNPRGSARIVGDSTTGNSRTVEVTISSTATWGSFFSWLEVNARAKPTPDAEPVSHTSKIRVQGQVFGELRAEPDTFRFGIKPGVEFVRSVRLHRPSGPFELKSAVVEQADIPGTTLTVKKISPSEYELTMQATADQLRPLAQGHVVVLTDVPGEEQVVIPIIGVVRVDNPGVQ